MNTMSLMTEEQLIDEFIGGRYLDNRVWSIVSPLLEPISETMYRGMMLPIHIIKEGLLLEEWYNMSHWSLDFNIARNFSLEPCPADGYIEEIADTFDISVDEACDMFVPVIIEVDGVEKGLRTYKLAAKYEATDIYIKEQEITTFGIYSLVTNIKKCADERGEYYLLEALSSTCNFNNFNKN